MSEYLESDWNKQRRERRRQREKRLIAIYISIFSAIAVLVVVAVIVGSGIFSSGEASAKQGNTEFANGAENMGESGADSENQKEETYIYLPQPEWEEMLLTPNEYSRPQKPLEEINGVVIHYVGNTGSTAKQNRDYFEDLATTHETSASSHFVIGLRGEIIQCVPLDEIAYATRQRNVDTISIEVCHPTDEGWFNQDTYDSVIALTAWLVVEYDLDIDDVIRHYDVTGKECPKYYVQNEDAWDRLKADVSDYIEEHSEMKTK